MTHTDPWTLLDLPPDCTEKQLKQRYAQLIRQHRPDTDPDGFARVRAAYEGALAELRWRTELVAVDEADAPHEELAGDASAPASDEPSDTLSERRSDRLSDEPSAAPSPDPCAMPGTEAAPQPPAQASELQPSDEAAAPSGATWGTLDTAMQALTTFIGEPPDEWTQDKAGDLAPFVAACRALDLDELVQAEAQCLEFYVRHGLRCPIKALQLAGTWQWEEASTREPGSLAAQVWDQHEALHARLSAMRGWIQQCEDSPFAPVWRAWLPVDAPPPRLRGSRQGAWLQAELQALQSRLGDISQETVSLRAARMRALRGPLMSHATLLAAAVCALVMMPMAYLWWAEWQPGSQTFSPVSHGLLVLATAMLSVAWSWPVHTLHRLALSAQARLRSGSVMALMRHVSNLDTLSGSWLLTWLLHAMLLSWVGRMLPEGVLPQWVLLTVLTVSMLVHAADRAWTRAWCRGRGEVLAHWRRGLLATNLPLDQMVRPDRSPLARHRPTWHAMDLDHAKLRGLTPEAPWWRRNKALPAMLLVGMVAIAGMMGWLGDTGRVPLSPAHQFAVQLSDSLSPQSLARLDRLLASRPGWSDEALAADCERITAKLKRVVSPHTLRQQVLQSAILTRTDLPAEQALMHTLSGTSRERVIQLAEELMTLQQLTTPASANPR